MRKARDGLLTISEAAARLKVHPKTLRQWADKGLVPVVRLPSGYRRFRPDEIDAAARAMGLIREDENDPAAGGRDSAGAGSRAVENPASGSKRGGDGSSVAGGRA